MGLAAGIAKVGIPLVGSLLGQRSQRKAAKGAARDINAGIGHAIGANTRLFQSGRENLLNQGNAAITGLAPFALGGRDRLDAFDDLLTNEGQTAFLQNNPLFQAGLQNLNTQTGKLAAARGRLSAGDTQEGLMNNAFLAGAPLLQNQLRLLLESGALGQNAATNIANIRNTMGQNLANLDTGEAGRFSDLVTGGAQATAAGRVGAANARSGMFGSIAGFASPLLQDFLLNRDIDNAIEAGDIPF